MHCHPERNRGICGCFWESKVAIIPDCRQPPSSPMHCHPERSEGSAAVPEISNSSVTSGLPIILPLPQRTVIPSAAEGSAVAFGSPRWRYFRIGDPPTRTFIYAGDDMETLKKTGQALLLMQCSFNVLTVTLFLFKPKILRPHGESFSMAARILVFGGALLCVATIGIFGYATQREQTYVEALDGEPEGGKVAQRDLTFFIVGLVSECLTLYWILH